MMRMRFIWVGFLLMGCGGVVGGVLDTGRSFPVYNQAYQEHYRADTLEDILQHARNAYVLIDPFEGTIRNHIAEMHADGNVVGGYISVGTGEKWREDFAELKPFLASSAWPEWPDEYFVSDVTSGILAIMKRRIDRMAAWGIDWVEMDNMDWLDARNRRRYGLHATVSEARAYVNALCDYAHAKGMHCMAKNTVKGFDRFDGVLYESYSDERNGWDHAGTQRFLASKKPVIINHYGATDCDAVYQWYQHYYHSEAIAFICEDVARKRYRHFTSAH